MNIADLFFMFRGEDKQLQLDAAKAGDKAGATLGQRIGSKMKIALGSALGAGITAGLQIAAKGALELDAATQQLIADTGLVGDEAEEARDQLASLYRDNLQGFDEIGIALAKVHTDLGLTGEAAKAATAEFLKFSTATGQDAGEAVSSFDDILDAFNLKAEDAAGIMDLLIESHQRYGGSISENQDALSKLAPALNAANLTVEDGVGLLNMFAAAGVDAAVAPVALAKALTQVESPEELKTLIEDIQNTADPFLRAEKAAKLFGTRAGAKLAQALSKGNLEDFVITMEEAAGATEEAAEAVENSFGNRFAMIMKNAGGALAEFGTNFGPLVLGFASLLPILAPVITAAGAALGGLLAAAIPVGMALLPVLLIAAVVAAIAFLIANPEIVGQIAKFAGEVVGNIIGFLASLPQKIADLFGKAFGKSAQRALEWVGKIVGFVLGIPAKLFGLPMAIAKVFVDVGLKVVGAVLGFVGKVVGFILSIPGKIIGLIGRVGQIAIDAAAALLAPFITVAEKIAEIVGGIGKRTNFTVDPMHPPRPGTPAPNRSGSPDDRNFASGTSWAPQGRAFLHEGEMVLPRMESDAIRAGRAFLGEAGGSGSEGGSFNPTINIEGLIPYRDPFEIAQQLKRVREFVTVTPRRQPA